MHLKNTLKSTLIGISLLGAGSVLAGSPTFSCPPGTHQIGGQGSKVEALACARTGDAGNANGPYVGFHKDGSVMVRGTYKDGFRDGKFEFFDVNGVKLTESNFRRGNYHGQRIEFFANGKPRLVESYVDGSRQGLQQEFDLRGNLVSSTEFRNDRKVASAK